MTKTMSKDEYKDLAPEVAAALEAAGGGRALTKERHPLVELVPEDQKPGRFLQGRYVGVSTYQDSNNQPRSIHTVELIATNAPTTEWDAEKRKANPVTVKELDRVSFFGSTMLDGIIADGIKPGNALMVAYLGKVKGKSGNAYHNWRVFDLTNK